MAPGSTPSVEKRGIVSPSGALPRGHPDRSAARAASARDFLLRREIYWEAGEAWTRKHRSWLTSIRFSDHASQATLADYLHAHDVLIARRDQVEADLASYAEQPAGPTVNRPILANRREMPDRQKMSTPLGQRELIWPHEPTGVPTAIAEWLPEESARGIRSPIGAGRAEVESIRRGGKDRRVVVVLGPNRSHQTSDV